MTLPDSDDDNPLGEPQPVEDLEAAAIQVECPFCAGDGWVIRDNERQECEECDGTGWY